MQSQAGSLAMLTLPRKGVATNTPMLLGSSMRTRRKVGYISIKIYRCLKSFSMGQLFIILPVLVISTVALSGG